MKTICTLVTVIGLFGQGHNEIEKLKPGEYYVELGSDYAIYGVTSSKDCFLVLPNYDGVQVGIYDLGCDNRENGYEFWVEENDRLQKTNADPVLNSNHMNNLLSSARSQAASQASRKPTRKVKKEMLQYEKQSKQHYRNRSSGRMRSK